MYEKFWRSVRYKTGWAIIIALTLIPTLRTLAVLNQQGITGSYGIMSALGIITGVAGMMLYALNLVLATRLKILENYFGGLNRMFIAHHIIGGMALIFLCFHPLLLALRLIDPITQQTIKYAAEFLWIQPISLSLPVTNYMAINFGIAAFLGLVFLLVITFFIKLPYKLWLFTHKFLGAAFFLAGIHVLFVKGLVSDDNFLKSYLMIWSVIGLVAGLSKTFASRIIIRHYKYRIDQVSKINKDVTEIALSPINNQINFQPGQFVLIKFKNSKIKGLDNESHPFSISSSNDKSSIRLDIKSLGDFSSKIQNVKPGTIAEVEGAYGKFSYKNFKNPNQVWIAGGIGITPFLAMANSLKNEKPMNIDLYYSVNDKEELIRKDELTQAINISKSKFRLNTHVTSLKGLLTADMIATQSKDLQNKEIFICGPPAMMKSLRQQLRGIGVSNNNIHSEEFSLT